jgi:uncharacterized membrane protein (DUF2068 family)
MDDAPISGAVQPPVHERGAGLLRFIGAFKVFKAVLLILTSISVFHLINKDLQDVILDWSRRLHIAPGNRYVDDLLDRVLTVTNRQLVVVGIVLLVYAAMFSVEGVGLLLLKSWAEWMTVITTSGLIPIEIFEMGRHPSRLKLFAMVINVAIAVYLFFHVRRETAQKRRESTITST